MEKFKRIACIFTLMLVTAPRGMTQVHAFQGTNYWLHKPEVRNANVWRAMPLIAIDNARDLGNRKKSVTVFRGTRPEIVYLNVSITNTVSPPKMEHHPK